VRVGLPVVCVARTHFTGEQLDREMDYESEGYEDDPRPGFRRINRVIAKCNGETHIYSYFPERTEECVGMVKLHVEEGQLHPYAGIMLVKMVREVSHDD
jgi:hypothetical protein